MRNTFLRRISSSIKIAQPGPTAPSEQFLKCPPVIELFVFLFITLIINLYFFNMNLYLKTKRHEDDDLLRGLQELSCESGSSTNRPEQE